MAAALILAGLGIAGTLIRATLHSGERLPAGDSVWRLTWTISANAQKSGAVIRLSPPWDTAHNRLFGQNLLHPGMRVQRPVKPERRRDIVTVATRPGLTQLIVMFDIHSSARARPSVSARPPLAAHAREALLGSEADIQVDDASVARAAKEIVTGDPDGLMQRIFGYITKQIGRNPSGPDDAASVIRVGQGTPLGRLRAMVALCRAAGIPARIVSGFVLRELAEAQPSLWLEAYFDERWQPFDPQSGYAGEVPPSYLPVRRGGDRFFETIDADAVQAKYSIARIDAPPGLYADESKRLVDVFNLNRLPIESRNALAILMLLPLGALLTATVRSVIGVHTYGTFTPTLLALSATIVDWRSATIIFALVIVIGFGGRALLPGLKLSRTPRLAIVFTLIAISMAFAVSIMEHYEFNPGNVTVLLPIVVLTTFVDRIYGLADEKGLQVALVRLLWTVGNAFLCFLVLLRLDWGDWIVAHPETHLVTVALVIAVYSYSGPKLSEQPWMRWLVEPKPPEKKEEVAAA